jgi:hypothetical protein
VTLVTHHPVIPVEENATFSTPITYRSVTSVTGRDKNRSIEPENSSKPYSLSDIKEGTPVNAKSPNSDSAEVFAVGGRVFLRGCPVGQPGTVLRLERGKLAVLWADLGPSYIGRHNPASLMEAEPQKVEASCKSEAA